MNRTVSSLLITLAIYAILANAGIDAPKYGGGAQAPLWYLGVVGVQALTLTFPFSQAMSVTRREFYLGTLLTAVLTGAILATVFVLGGLIAQMTDGWGMNGYFFYLAWIWEGGPLAAGVFFFTVSMLFFFVIGFWAATIYKRFGSAALTIVLVGLGVLLVVGLFFVGQAGVWWEVFSWFGTQGALRLSLWGLLIGLLLAAITYGTLRRATP